LFVFLFFFVVATGFFLANKDIPIFICFGICPSLTLKKRNPIILPLTFDALHGALRIVIERGILTLA